MLQAGETPQETFDWHTYVAARELKAFKKLYAQMSWVRE